MIVGPKDDPAGVAEAKSAVDAYRRIAAAKALFLSRGDNSGTHKREMAIWRAAGIQPAGDWYLVTHKFMTATLLEANRLGGYFMCDSSTWIANRKRCGNLGLLFGGDRMLVNVYHALMRRGAPTLAARFLEYLASPTAQHIIAEYGRRKFDQPLYHPASYARMFDQ